MPQARLSLLTHPLGDHRREAAVTGRTGGRGRDSERQGSGILSCHCANHCRIHLLNKHVQAPSVCQERAGCWALGTGVKGASGQQRKWTEVMQFHSTHSGSPAVPILQMKTLREVNCPRSPPTDSATSPPPLLLEGHEGLGAKPALPQRDHPVRGDHTQASSLCRGISWLLDLSLPHSQLLLLGTQEGTGVKGRDSKPSGPGS